MNVIKIIDVLQNKINAATTAEEVLYLSKCLENLNLGNVKTVSSYVNLLALNPIKGEVCFVENEEKLYYWFNNFWVSVLDQAVAITYAWGAATNGRLGDNTTVSKSSPVSVVGGFTDWVQMSAGYTHSLGVRENGTLWGWGANSYGQLGDNTIVNNSSPVSVVGGFTDWTQASAGRQHSLAIRENGTAWAWGDGANGKLGDNTVANKSSPVLVAGGFTNWIQVDSGGQHSIGLRANGVAYAWGLGTVGRLGDNTIVNKSSPVSVVGGFDDWKYLNTGYAHNMAIRTNGTLWAWGYNVSGGLGDNSTVSKSSPVSVVGGFTDWIQVATGSLHSVGLRANGTLWSWGYAGQGALGDNQAATNKSSPASVVGGFTDWVRVEVGTTNNVAVRANGTLWTWGLNLNGTLGDNTVANKSSPVSVIGGFTDWVQADAGTGHVLAIRIN